MRHIAHRRTWRRHLEGSLSSRRRSCSRSYATGRRAQRNRRRRHALSMRSRPWLRNSRRAAIRSPAARAFSSVRYTAARSTTNTRKNVGWRAHDAGCPTAMTSALNKNSAIWSAPQRPPPAPGRSSSGDRCAAAFALDLEDPLVGSFQTAYASHCGGVAQRRQAIRGRRQQLLVACACRRLRMARARRTAHGTRVGIDRLSSARGTALCAIAALYCSSAYRHTERP